MKTCRMIIVGGMSGAGKSTLSNKISVQLNKNSIPAVWLHEEMRDHPIRSGEFSEGSLHSPEDFRRNLEIQKTRWKTLAEKAALDNKIYVIEGCYFQNIIRYFFVNDYPKGKILKFYEAINLFLQEIDMRLIFLFSSAPEKTLERVYPERGEWWKNLVLDPKGYEYMENRNLSGPEGLAIMRKDYQSLSNDIFSLYRGKKLIIDTADGNWPGHLDSVLSFLGIKMIPPRLPVQIDPDRHTGKYGDGENSISIINDDNGLYCKAFWDIMKLEPLSDDHYRFSAFPVELKFIQDEPEKVEISGNYDWDIVGNVLEKTEG